MTLDTNKSARSSSSSLATESPTSVEKSSNQSRQRSKSPVRPSSNFERRVTFTSEDTNESSVPNTQNVRIDHVKPKKSHPRQSNSRHKKTWWTRFNRFPLANSLATLSLAVAAVGLLFFGWRSLRNETYNLHHTYVQNCLNWDVQKLGDMTSECEDMLRRFRNGEFKPPYPVYKRAIDGLRKRSMDLSASLLSRSDSQVEHSHNWTYAAGIVFLLSTILVVALKFNTLTNIRSSLSFQQPRRRNSGFHFATQQRFQGYSKASYDGRDYTVLRHQPSSHEDLHKLGHWLRSSASSSSSSVDSSASGELRRRSTQKRKLAIRHPTKDEEEAYDSLIELPSKKDTKIFFEPNTGAYIHLTPWKSQADDEEEGEVQEGDTKGAIAKMGSGAVAFAAGKMVGGKIAEEIECFEEGKIREKILPRATEGTQYMMLDEKSED